MRAVILGTAGHIDHGKTALVQALTGTDTDRLKEEKARGITIELGFAELEREGLPPLGVVDVPGHEAFVRSMVAGAAGMDVVLLAVAGDEGVMPQTREHLAIVELLGVAELVVALTKCDSVDSEWLELVEADVEALLAETRYRGSPQVATSAKTGQGLDALVRELSAAADRIHSSEFEDLTRLPFDRVFTIQGTGTVATGTLWTGSLSVGERVRILPEGLEARVRGLQVHGRDVSAAHAGDRTAVALSGEGADRGIVSRGATLVTAPEWEATLMLTARVRILEDSGWSLTHNQRVHVHHATSEVLARCVLLQQAELLPGEEGWIQLRLEEPLVVRVRDRLVMRAYSPVATFAGGIVAEVNPPKRNRLDQGTAGALATVVDGAPDDAIAAHLDLMGWDGAVIRGLAVQLGLPAAALSEHLDGVEAFRAGDRLFAPVVLQEAEARILSAVAEAHARDPLRPTVSLSLIRASIPGWAPRALADAVIGSLVDSGRLESAEGGVRDPGHRPSLTAEQEEAYARLGSMLADVGLSAPFVDDFPDDLRSREDLWSLLHRMEGEGGAIQVADGLYMSSAHVEAAGVRVRTLLGGRSGLGPADFREALPVTRKHLIPLLNYFDGKGTTIREAEGRCVPDE